MVGGQSPTTIRRRLRAELRRLRKDAGLSIEEVRSRVEWSPSKLVRIEGGQVGISVSDLEALLRVYQVDDEQLLDELKDLARASRQTTWWGRFQRYLPATYLDFIGAESDAIRIQHYHPTTIPGLLQTPAYIEAINEATSLSAESVEQARARNEVRRLRQRYVLDRGDPPSLTAMIDEAVLRRPVGGAAVMREQLAHLIHLAGRDEVTMVVVPLRAGPHPGLNGAFTLMQYHAPTDEDVVCLETTEGMVIMRDQPEVTAQYHRVAKVLFDKGLREADAVRFIQTILDEG